MTKYSAYFHGEYQKDVKRVRKNTDLVQRLNKKVKEILENPYHYKPLRNVLKGRRRTHIGSYVLIFEIQEEEKTVVFLSFQHHDVAYKG